VTLAEDIAAQDRRRRVVQRNVNILTLDIETTPHLAYSFDVWQANISPDKIVEPSRVIVVGFKWYGGKQAQALSERTHTHDALVRESWQLCDRADLIVSYNGIKFDLKHLRREWALAGLPPPSPFKQVDLYQTTKRVFAFPSNKLDAVSQAAGVGQKIKHEGFGLWRKCLDGDEKAWRTMERYCKGDVELTERYYDWLRPWIHNHPHVTNSDGLRCNRCGSANLHPIGDYSAVVLAYGQYRCSDCGGTLRASNSKRIARTRGTA
jgi:DNA-directed RNA polymerase subunit RPC12/RpoP